MALRTGERSIEHKNPGYRLDHWYIVYVILDSLHILIVMREPKEKQNNNEK